MAIQFQAWHLLYQYKASLPLEKSAITRASPEAITRFV